MKSRKGFEESGFSIQFGFNSIQNSTPLRDPVGVGVGVGVG